MFNTVTLKELKSKSGNVIPAGSNVSVECTETRARVHFGEIVIQVQYRYAFLFVKGFKKEPSLKTLEKWEYDSGTCLTPLGNKTEPDGHDYHGCPSWMLILGVI